MTELEESLQLLIKAMLENQPRHSSDRFDAGGTYTLPTAIQVKLTFDLDLPLYVVRLIKAYADSRSGCTYKWIINGQTWNLNEQEFYMGKVVHDNPVLIVANTSGVDQTFGYKIIGWGDLKTGG